MAVNNPFLNSDVTLPPSPPDDVDIEQANVIVTVHDDDINVWHHNNNAEMDHMFTISPKKTEEWDIINTFIKKFDGGGDVEPFNIEVETN